MFENHRSIGLNSQLWFESWGLLGPGPLVKEKNNFFDAGKPIGVTYGGLITEIVGKNGSTFTEYSFYGNAILKKEIEIT